MTPSAITILMMLPLGVFGMVSFKPRDAPPIAPVAVQTESITERRADDATFRRRWPAELPPAVVIREVPVRVVAEAAVPVRPTAAHSEVPAPSPRPARIMKRVSLDICARHGMRRVDYGRRWRCRK